MVPIETSAAYRIEKIQSSGISEAFTPSTPVSHKFFCGRSKEVDMILNAVVSSKSHILATLSHQILCAFCLTLNKWSEATVNHKQ